MSLWDRPDGPVSGTANVPNQIPMNQQASLPGPLPVTLIVATTAETLVPSAALSTVALTCTLQQDTAIEQTLFNAIASGIIATTNTTNITLGLYAAKSTVGVSAIGSGTLLKASTATAQNTVAAASFFIKAELIFDSVSGTLAGTVKFYINKTLIAEATLTNFPTGFVNAGNPSVNPPTASVLPQFYLTITSSAATALLPTTLIVQKFNCG